MSVLVALWVWFASILGSPPCLTAPTILLVYDTGPTSVGTYTPSTQTVRVERGLTPRLQRLVAVHEYAHHYWHVCRIQHKPLGWRFLRHTDDGYWNRTTMETFAHTLAWALTGQGHYMVDRDAARVFRHKITDPTILERLET